MANASIKYWIATHYSERAKEGIKKLIKLKNWQYGKSYQDLSIGDVILFYASTKGKKGKNERRIVGKATITSTEHAPTRKSITGGDVGEYEIDFDNINLWGPPVPFTKEMNKSLNFINKAPNPGLAFKDKAFIKIDEHDYNVIKNR